MSATWAIRLLRERGFGEGAALLESELSPARPAHAPQPAPRGSVSPRPSPRSAGSARSAGSPGSHRSSTTRSPTPVDVSLDASWEEDDLVCESARARPPARPRAQTHRQTSKRLGRGPRAPARARNPHLPPRRALRREALGPRAVGGGGRAVQQRAREAREAREARVAGWELGVGGGKGSDCACLPVRAGGRARAGRGHACAYLSNQVCPTLGTAGLPASSGRGAARLDPIPSRAHGRVPATRDKPEGAPDGPLLVQLGVASANCCHPPDRPTDCGKRATDSRPASTPRALGLSPSGILPRAGR